MNQYDSIFKNFRLNVLSNVLILENVHYKFVATV